MKVRISISEMVYLPSFAWDLPTAATSGREVALTINIRPLWRLGWEAAALALPSSARRRLRSQKRMGTWLLDFNCFVKTDGC